MPTTTAFSATFFGPDDGNGNDLDVLLIEPVFDDVAGLYNFNHTHTVYDPDTYTPTVTTWSLSETIVSQFGGVYADMLSALAVLGGTETPFA